MSYYIGFRHGWVRIGRRLVADLPELRAADGP